MNQELQAILTGVARHIEEIDEAERLHSGGDGPGAWALHGRQTIMQMRDLVQRRLVKR
jgi:hypothetical protein